MIDVAKGFFLSLAKGAIPRIDYFAFYRGVVRSQSSDLGKVDVQPDDPRLPGMKDVQIRPGLPGTKVKIPNGVSVMIGFMGGRPSMPYVETWESGSGVTEVQVGGTRKVARLDDSTKNGSISGTNGGGPVTFTYTDPDGIVTVGASIQVKGKIDSASDILRAG